MLSRRILIINLLAVLTCLHSSCGYYHLYDKQLVNENQVVTLKGGYPLRLIAVDGKGRTGDYNSWFGEFVIYLSPGTHMLKVGYYENPSSRWYRNIILDAEPAGVYLLVAEFRRGYSDWEVYIKKIR